MKILDVYRKAGVPGFLVDVAEEGSKTIRRWNFADDMLEGDKYVAEIKRILDEERETRANEAKSRDVPGAAAEDPLATSRGRNVGKEI